MSDTSNPDPLAGPDDDDPTAAPETSGDDEGQKAKDDGSEWIPEPLPTEGDGPLP